MDLIESQPVSESTSFNQQSPATPSQLTNRHTQNSSPQSSSLRATLANSSQFVHTDQPNSLTLKVTHINLARRHAAASALISNHSNLRNILVSINEPPFNNSRVRCLNNFQYLTNSKVSSEKIGAVIAGSGPNISVCQISDLSNINCSVAEIAFNSFNFIMISIYMPPSIEICQSLGHLTQVLDRFRARPVLICSDTNARNPSWLDREINERGRILDEFVHLNQLVILNEDSAFTYTGSAGCSLIDLMMCNSQMLRHLSGCSTVTNPPSLSDHHYVKTTITISTDLRPIKFQNSTRKFSTRNADWKSFQKTLLDLLGESHLDPNCCSKASADEFLNNFYEILFSVCHQYLKRVKPGVLGDSPWFDEECRASKKKVSKALHRLQDATTDLKKVHYNSLYHQARMEHKLLIRDKKLASWQQYCNNVSKQTMFECLKIVRSPPKSTLSTITKPNGEITTGHSDTLNALLDAHFPCNPQHLKSHNPPPLDFYQTCEIQSTTELEIETNIRKLKRKGAPGQDGITGEIIKNNSPILSVLLSSFFNSLFLIGYFPDRWKTGVACFIPKQNSQPGTVKSSRPITLLDNLGKLLEKSINERLVDFLFRNAKMSLRQYGFVRQRSTEDAVCDLLEHIRSNRARKRFTVVIALDIAAAFDSADWSLIVDTLKKLSVPQYLVNILASYLHNRHIKTTNQLIQKRPLTQGCPQGSCLGPTLWNVLINEMLTAPLLLGKHAQAFADDMIICLSSERLDEAFVRECESTIKATYDFGSKLKLKFNQSKTQVMIFSPKKNSASPLVELQVSGNTIESTGKLLYLGVLLDNQLTFKEHLKNKIIRANTQLNLLRRIAAQNYGLTAEITKILYKTVIEPSLTYCSPAFAHRLTVKAFVKSLRSIQRKCCLTISRAFATSRTETVIAVTGLLPIDYVIKAKEELRRVKQTGAFGDQGVEREKHWLSKTPIWEFKPVNQIEEQGDTEFQCIAYTDGSKSDLGTGYGGVVYTTDGKIEFSDKLDEHCTVYQAELLAIRKAIELCIENGQRDTKVLICTDSKSSLQSIGNTARQYWLAAEIRTLVERLRNELNTEAFLMWVPAHAGILGNEEADELAKRGGELGQIEVHLNRSIGTVSAEILRNHRFDWNISALSAVSEWSSRFVSLNLSTGLLNRYSTQFFTGHGLFNSHRHKLGLAESAACSLCGEPADTPLHALLWCPALQPSRAHTLHQIGIRELKDLRVLQDANTHPLFLQFCKNHHEQKKRNIFATH